MTDSFDPKKKFLGKLCRKGHAYKKTRKSLRYKFEHCHCVECRGIQQRIYAQKNKEKTRARSQKNSKKLRLSVLVYYGGDPPRCACCGELSLEFLNIDHVKGGGQAHRRQINVSSGGHFYRWLIKNNFPEGYRILCCNCNSSHGNYGYCPHEDKILKMEVKRK